MFTYPKKCILDTPLRKLEPTKGKHFMLPYLDKHITFPSEFASFLQSYIYKRRSFLLGTFLFNKHKTIQLQLIGFEFPLNKCCSIVLSQVKCSEWKSYRYNLNFVMSTSIQLYFVRQFFREIHD